MAARKQTFNLMVAFGRQAKIRRRRLGLSQEEVAVRAKLHRTYISDIEQGVRNLSLDTMMKLATGLSTTVSELLYSAEESLKPKG